MNISIFMGGGGGGGLTSLAINHDLRVSSLAELLQGNMGKLKYERFCF